MFWFTHVRPPNIAFEYNSLSIFQLTRNKLPSIDDQRQADRVTILANPNPWSWLMTMTWLSIPGELEAT